MHVKVIIKEPFKDFRVVVVGKEDFSKLVGGLIEFVTLGPDLEIIINEEGKLLGLPANLLNFLHGDVIFGTAIFVKVDGYGEVRNLTEAEAILPNLRKLFPSLTEEASEKIDPEDFMQVRVYPF